LAKNAGMKHIVITAKYHEGYAMWNSSVPGFTDATGKTEYDITDYSDITDNILGDLKVACDAAGLKFCLDYSILDWNHSSKVINYDYYYWADMDMSQKEAYVAAIKSHLAELIKMYDPAILWFDGDWCKNLENPTSENWWKEADGRDLYNYVISLKPNIIVNERVKRDLGLGDYAVAEYSVPAVRMYRPWERCETMNGAWGYCKTKEDQYKSSAELIRQMVTIVSRDGNFLLNIGPKGDGTVTQGSVAILEDFAEWISIYSDSIYGTIGNPFGSEPSWGKYTAKNNTLYTHVFDWPNDYKLSIPKLTNKITRIYLMGNPTNDLSYTATDTSTDIVLPETAPNSTDSVILIEVDAMPQAGNIFENSVQSIGSSIMLGQTKSERNFCP
jgi:alpha-L-fucosidase